MYTASLSGMVTQNGAVPVDECNKRTTKVGLFFKGVPSWINSSHNLGYLGVFTCMWLVDLYSNKCRSKSNRYTIHGCWALNKIMLILKQTHLESPGRCYFPFQLNIVFLSATHLSFMLVCTPCATC